MESSEEVPATISILKKDCFFVYIPNRLVSKMEEPNQFEDHINLVYISEQIWIVIVSSIPTEFIIYNHLILLSCLG